MFRIKRFLSDGTWVQEYATTNSWAARELLNALRVREPNVRYDLFEDRNSTPHVHTHRRVKNTFLCVCTVCGIQVECYIRHGDFEGERQ